MYVHCLTWNPVSNDHLIFSDIEDVNKAFEEMHAEVERKINKQEYELAMGDQNQINEVICAENCAARWLWKSG